MKTLGQKYGTFNHGGRWMCAVAFMADLLDAERATGAKDYQAWCDRWLACRRLEHDTYQACTGCRMDMSVFD